MLIHFSGDTGTPENRDTENRSKTRFFFRHIYSPAVK